MSHLVGSALCDTRQQALTEIVESWLYAGSINNSHEVAEMSVEDVLAEMKSMDCEYQAAPMPPQYDDDGERVYEDLEPEEDEVRDIIRRTINEARQSVSDD